MTLLRDLVSHHIQQHSTKSTNRIYLLPCFWRLTFLVHQTSFIYYQELASYIALLKKPISRYPIYWEAHQLLCFLLGSAPFVILLRF